MDTYGVQAALHMSRYGTTQAQIAAAAAKNHTYGAKNPMAQYRFEMNVQDVLADRHVSGPLTRAMCAPIGDGAAAAVLCSADFLKKLPVNVRKRAVRVRASVVTGGKFRAADEPSLSRLAADRADNFGEGVSVAILLVDYRTGEIIASVGSAGLLDVEREGFVDMTRAIRSPGSPRSATSARCRTR